MPLAAGSSFAGFTIVRLLGSGGMGEVYLAHHPRLPRRDAVKVLPSGFSDDPDYRARFEREADLASTLWHPHIVGVHDRGEADGQLWIAMDFVDGLDAGRLLAQRYSSGMPTNLVIRIVTAAASALDHAHKQGMLHRDVKPANIMLSAHDDHEQRILLTDFGIARRAGDISGLTATNMTVGTVAFAAPEQLMGDTLDGRADQYALAATAYTLLTGKQLFAHSNPAVVISRHLNATPPSVGATHPELAVIDGVLARALAKDVEDRFPRCTDFARALTAAAGSERPSPDAVTLNAVAIADKPTARPAKARDTPVLASKARISSRRLLAGALIVTAVVLAAAMIVWRPWQHNTPHAEGTAAPAPASSPAMAPPPTANSPPPPAPARPAATDIQTTMAVIDGLPTNGFHEVPNPNANVPLDCEVKARAAVTANVYDCSPTSASADLCWSAPPTSMLCLDNPWDKELRRFPLGTFPLRPVQHGVDPWPYALELDDGTRCRVLIGMRDIRSNGDTPEYDCGSGQDGFAVLMSRDSANPINRASSMWTVKAGAGGAVAQTRIVTTAWFAGAN
jgi:serine/threonine protein kinase